MIAACIQMCSGADPKGNIAQASALIRRAAKKGATLIATPEMTGFLQRKPNLLWETIAAQEDDISLAAFKALAAQLGVTLLIGSLAIKVGEGRAVNRSYLIGPSGAVIAHYDKIHLFDVTLSRQETYRESSNYDAGSKAVLADIGQAKLGLSICYDVRFAALYKDYAKAGAHILTVPAAFTVPTGQAHWEVLLRARAIETGCFVLAPAQGGQHEDGRATYGHSLILGPWGEIIAQLDHDEPGVILADLDLLQVQNARAKIPAWSQSPSYDRP